MNLHGKIMNLQCSVPKDANINQALSWKEGHKQARHDAAELANAADAEIEQLRLAEEGAKEAFGHVVQQKRDLEAECKRLRGLLDSADEAIRRNAATNNAM